jgi:nitrate/TMAO reductase-like tetraheme cytochrome c subunit
MACPPSCCSQEDQQPLDQAAPVTAKKYNITLPWGHFLVGWATWQVSRSQVLHSNKNSSCVLCSSGNSRGEMSGK